MADDPRSCATGVCIINAEGYCWCGQKWDGRKMSRPLLDKLPESAPAKQAAVKAVNKTAKRTVRKAPGKRA